MNELSNPTARRTRTARREYSAWLKERMAKQQQKSSSSILAARTTRTAPSEEDTVPDFSNFHVDLILC